MNHSEKGFRRLCRIAQQAIRESEQVMKAVPGLQSIDFAFETGKMTDGKEITREDLTRRLEAAGRVFRPR